MTLAAERKADTGAPSPRVVLSARKLTRYYTEANGGKVAALAGQDGAGVDLDVRAGEVLAVIGASGSGKSTLLQLLGGLDEPTSGQVLLAGQDLAAMNDRDATEFRRKRIGFVFQAYHLVSTLTLGENVALSSIIGDEQRSSWVGEAYSLLETLGLGRRMDSYPEALSGGERQRVAVARALFGGPELLLADEPTGNLDSVNTSAVLALIRDAVDEGKASAAVLVTHDPAAAAVADRIIALRDGAVATETLVGGWDNDRIRTWLASAAQ